MWEGAASSYEARQQRKTQSRDGKRTGALGANEKQGRTTRAVGGVGTGNN
jgi:hypothetical protein